MFNCSVRLRSANLFAFSEHEGGRGPKGLQNGGAVLKRRRAARAALNFIDEEASDADAPPTPEPDDPDAPQTSKRKARRGADLKTYTLLNCYQWNTSYRPKTANFFSAQLHGHGGKLFQQYCFDAFSKIEKLV